MARRRARWRRLFAAQDGGTLVEFALVVPLMTALSLGILDFSLMLLDYHRAGEAVRRGTREAVLALPVPDLSNLENSAPITCLSTASTVSCGGAVVQNAASFATVVTAMRAILPSITTQSVRIEYRYSGIGDASVPSGAIPLVTVRIENFQYNFLVLDTIPSMPTGLTFPTFAVSLIGNGAAVSP